MLKFSGLSRVAFAGACVAVSVACGACSVVGDGAGKTLTGSLASPTTKLQPLGTADSSPKTQRPSAPSPTTLQALHATEAATHAPASAARERPENLNTQSP